jgi:hypothetical protein
MPLYDYQLAEMAQIVLNLRQCVEASEAKDKYIKELEMQADRMRAEIDDADKASAYWHKRYSELVEARGTRRPEEESEAYRDAMKSAGRGHLLR